MIFHAGYLRGAAVIAPVLIAHADWGTDRRKRQVAMARLLPAGSGPGPGYLVDSLASAPDGTGSQGDLFASLRAAAGNGQVLAEHASRASQPARRT